jgi:predicted  nucleic acid-binding Zn-ribbon protein
MSADKINSLRASINSLEIQRAFVLSCVATLLEEANNLDRQATTFVQRAEAIENELRDLEAELKDTL